MNTATHTPGPWILSEKTVFKDHGFKVYGYPISAGGQAIARVHAGSVGKEAFSFGNQEANARLIAAAPAMLAALEAFMSVAHYEINSEKRLQAAVTARHLGKDAIALARGE